MNETSFWAKLGEVLIRTDWSAVVNAISVATGHKPPYVLMQPPPMEPGQPPPIQPELPARLDPPRLQLESPPRIEWDTAETMRIVQEYMNRGKCSKRNEIRWLRIYLD